MAFIHTCVDAAEATRPAAAARLTAEIQLRNQQDGSALMHLYEEEGAERWGALVQMHGVRGAVRPHLGDRALGSGPVLTLGRTL